MRLLQAVGERTEKTEGWTDMSGLKQKIQENTTIIYNVLRSFEHGKHHTFPSGLVAYQDDKILLFSDVLGLLDEATKQIREKAKTPKDLHIPLYWGKMVSLDEVLAVLEGAEQQ
jgi:hypothetical protein